MKYLLLTILMLGSLLRSDAQDLGWAAQLGGTLFDHAYAVMTDDSGHVYTTGSFEGFADLDPGPAFNVFLSAGDVDVFVSKLDRDGQRWYRSWLRVHRGW